MQSWRLVTEQLVCTDTVTGLGLESANSNKSNMLFGADVPDQFTGSEHPKYAFGFTMEILFSEGDNPILGNSRPEFMTFALKTATRPQPTITYTDANFYNLRTKIATSVDWGTITVTFYDDGRNRAHDLYQRYINSISPLTNLDFIDTVEPFGATSSIGPLNRGMGLIKTITLYQYFNQPGPEGVKEYRNLFIYFNPKITSVVYDDLAMDGDISTIALSFTCDGISMRTEVAD